MGQRANRLKGKWAKGQMGQRHGEEEAGTDEAKTRPRRQRASERGHERCAGVERDCILMGKGKDARLNGWMKCMHAWTQARMGACMHVCTDQVHGCARACANEERGCMHVWTDQVHGCARACANEVRGCMHVWTDQVHGYARACANEVRGCMHVWTDQ
eukprot:353481-Chlamydomonas_euryale.AAC.6